LPTITNSGALEPFVDHSKLYLSFSVKNTGKVMKKIDKDLSKIAAWCYVRLTGSNISLTLRFCKMLYHRWCFQNYTMIQLYSLALLRRTVRTEESTKFCSDTILITGTRKYEHMTPVWWQWRSQSDNLVMLCKYFGVHSPRKQSISKEINNDNVLIFIFIFATDRW
jgi:hypothetical protein